MSNYLFHSFFKFPLIDVTYSSPLSSIEVIQKLKEITDEDITFAQLIFRQFSHPYRGLIKATHFEIIKTVRYKNSFVPLIRGQLKETNEGLQIEIKISLLRRVQIFMFFWLCSTLNLFALFLYLSLSKGELNLGLLTLFPLGFFFFGRTIMNRGFNRESTNVISDFDQIFNTP